MTDSESEWQDNPLTCPCVANERPTPPCDERCFHFSGKLDGFCENCGQDGGSARALDPPGEIVLAYNTDGRNRVGPYQWQKCGYIYQCLDGPHKGTYANPERLALASGDGWTTIR